MSIASSLITLFIFLFCSIQIRKCMRGNKFYKLIDLILGTCILLLLRLLGLKPRHAAPTRPSVILAIKLAALGDTLLLLPTLRAIHRQYPQATIHYIGTSMNQELAALFPETIYQFHKFDIQKAVANPLSFLRFIRTIRSLHPDIAIDFEQWSMITPIMIGLSGAKATVGFSYRKRFRHILFSRTLSRRTNIHEIHNFLRLAKEGLGIPGTPEVELPDQPNSFPAVQELLQSQGWKPQEPLVVLHPGCGSHGFPREWPIALYQELCRQLHAHYPELFFVFTGHGASEQHLTQTLHETIPDRSALALNLPLAQTIALLYRTRLFVSGNTGIMHLAAAAGIPQIALHGPTNPVQWGPQNPKAVVLQSTCPQCPCLDLGFEYHRTDGQCMTLLPFDLVYSTATRLLEDSK
jgi:ADP-heptose:LPS heptosyltransferase